MRAKAIKLLEENVDSKFFDISLSTFVVYVSSGKGSKTKNKPMGLHQTKKLLQSEGNYQNVIRPPSEWEEIFANNTSNKGLTSKIQKEHIQLNIKTTKTNNPIRKWTEAWTEIFLKKINKCPTDHEIILNEKPKESKGKVHTKRRSTNPHFYSGKLKLRNKRQWEGMGFPGGASGKESFSQCRKHRLGFDPWAGKIPWRMANHSSILFENPLG